MDHVIIVAAGSGERLGAGVPKALVEVAGAPLVAWSIRAAAACPRVAGIVVAAPREHVELMRRAIPAGLDVPVVVVQGGSSRQRSVLAALDRVPNDATGIAVHDAARPLITPEAFDSVLAVLEDVPAAIAASPVADTLKRAGTDALVAATIDRAGLWRAETPQAFRAATLRTVFAGADDAELDTATDDASMVEARGVPVLVVDIGAPNLKVTTAADLDVVGALLARVRLDLERSADG